LLSPTPLAAAPLVQQLAALVDKPGRPADAAHYQLARTLLYQAQGEASLAIYHGELCLAAARETGGALFAILFPTVIASAFVEAGQPERALALVAQARSTGAGTAYHHHEALMLMVEAYARAALHDAPAAHTLLAQALTRAQDERTAPLLRWLVVGLPRMLAMALRAGIQADHAHSLIARFGVLAETPEVDPWPWPIRIYTLGRFALVIDRAPPRSDRKVQKKPLDMLKYLVAHGGRDISASAVNAALWPDAEGSAAVESFEVTLRRLRKLLGRDEAVQLKDGKLALNPGMCWVDTWVFERTQRRAEAGIDPDAAEGRGLTLYAGHFLAGDDEKPWLIACRQRLASKFLRHAAAVGQFWHDAGEPGKAELVYQRALELDPLAEPLYQRLIGLQSAQGRRAEALATYRRCRQMLSVVLGVEPSAPTQALRRSLGDDA
jgi:DNA-binding SARP family transcriptional activator